LTPLSSASPSSSKSSLPTTEYNCPKGCGYVSYGRKDGLYQHIKLHWKCPAPDGERFYGSILPESLGDGGRSKVANKGGARFVGRRRKPIQKGDLASVAVWLREGWIQEKNAFNSGLRWHMWFLQEGEACARTPCPPDIHDDDSASQENSEYIF
jgi:hypothetical protein